MLFRRFLLPLIAAAAVSATPAMAGTRSIIFTPPDFGGSPQGLDITDGGDTIGTLRFTLPQDFKKNSKARLRFVFQNFRSACILNFGILEVSRNRPGFDQVTTPPAILGFAGAEVGPVPLGGDRTIAKSYEMSPGNFGSFSGQKKGDVIQVTFIREMTGPDTCSGLPLIAIELRYQTP